MQLNLQKAEATLTAASSLLSKLSSEKRNWSAQAGALRAALQHVAQHSALAAAFITYAASEAEAVRASLVLEWCSAVELAAFNFRCSLPVPSSSVTDVRGSTTSEGPCQSADGVRGLAKRAERQVYVGLSRHACLAARLLRQVFVISQATRSCRCPCTANM